MIARRPAHQIEELQRRQDQLRHAHEAHSQTAHHHHGKLRSVRQLAIAALASSITAIIAAAISLWLGLRGHLP